MIVPASRYELREKIGSGHPSLEIFAARQPGLDRAVEVRISSKALPKGSPALAHWRLELKTLAGLDHRSLMKVLDTGHGEGRQYYVTDRRRACPLGEVLTGGHRTFEADECLRLGEEIASALAGLHEAGTVHRDITSRSVFYDLDREHPYIAHTSTIALRGEPAVASGQDDGSLSPEFLLTPEAVHGLPVDERTDLFMLSALLFEILVGKNPLREDLVYPHGRRAAPSYAFPCLSEAAPGLPPPVSDFFARTLAEKPQDRPPDGGAYVERIHRVLSKLKVADELSRSISTSRTARPIDMSSTFTRRRRRKKEPDEKKDRTTRRGLGRLALASALMAAGLVGVAAGTRWFDEAPPQPSATPLPHQTPRRRATTHRQVSRSELRRLSAKILDIADRVGRDPSRDRPLFFRRWALLKGWFACLPPASRSSPLPRYGEIVAVKTLYFANDKDAGRRLDRYLRRAGQYIRSKALHR